MTRSAPPGKEERLGIEELAHAGAGMDETGGRQLEPVRQERAGEELAGLRHDDPRHQFPDLVVPVIAFAVVRAGALGDLGAALVVVAVCGPDSLRVHPDHGCNSINEPVIKSNRFWRSVR